MKASFIELPAFQRHRSSYLVDDEFSDLQKNLLHFPEIGEIIEGTGGLRKMRYRDVRRGKGKRGGLRVIYYWWSAGDQFWLFTIYDKDEMEDLSSDDRRQLRTLLKNELKEKRGGKDET